MTKRLEEGQTMKVVEVEYDRGSLRADIIAAVERDDMTGFCTACGDQAGPVEPDAREYRCESCGENAVYGAEELLFHFVS